VRSNAVVPRIEFSAFEYSLSAIGYQLSAISFTGR
jgi:hypothetical protein